MLLGVQLPGVTQLFGEQLDGAIFDVFTVNDGVITRIDEFKTKDDALTFARTTAAPAQPGQSKLAPDAPAVRRPRVERVVPIDDVDAVHKRCVAQGLDVTHPPTSEPWGVRECHVRHPDGHVFRISREL